MERWSGHYLSSMLEDAACVTTLEPSVKSQMGAKQVSKRKNKLKVHRKYTDQLKPQLVIIIDHTSP